MRHLVAILIILSIAAVVALPTSGGSHAFGYEARPGSASPVAPSVDPPDALGIEALARIVLDPCEEPVPCVEGDPGEGHCEGMDYYRHSYGMYDPPGGSGGREWEDEEPQNYHTCQGGGCQADMHTPCSPDFAGGVELFFRVVALLDGERLRGFVHANAEHVGYLADRTMLVLHGCGGGVLAAAPVSPSQARSLGMSSVAELVGPHPASER